MNKELILEARDLTKSYKSQEVLNVKHIEIQQGEIVGLIGNNGAGKTTLMSLILDLIKPSSGWVKSKSTLVSQSEEWKQYTGSYLDESFLINFLTPDEYFKFVGELHGMKWVETKEFVSGFENIFNGEIQGQKKYIRDLSKGNQKKVGIVAALIGSPDIVILDEPFANLDPTTQLRIKKLVQDLSESTTSIISSHDINQVTDLASRIILLEKGRIVKDVQKNESTLKELSEYFHSQLSKDSNSNQDNITPS